MFMKGKAALQEAPVAAFERGQLRPGNIGFRDRPQCGVGWAIHMIDPMALPDGDGDIDLIQFNELKAMELDLKPGGIIKANHQSWDTLLAGTVLGMSQHEYRAYWQLHDHLLRGHATAGLELPGEQVKLLLKDLPDLIDLERKEAYLDTRKQIDKAIHGRIVPMGSMLDKLYWQLGQNAPVMQPNPGQHVEIEWKTTPPLPNTAQQMYTAAYSQVVQAQMNPDLLLSKPQDPKSWAMADFEKGLG